MSESYCVARKDSKLGLDFVGYDSVPVKSINFRFKFNVSDYISEFLYEK